MERIEDNDEKGKEKDVFEESSSSSSSSESTTDTTTRLSEVNLKKKEKLGDDSGKMQSSYVDLDEIEKIHKSLQDAFMEEKTLKYEWRVGQLNQIVKMLCDNKKQFVDALIEDLAQVTIICDSEVNGTISEAQYHLSHLSSWMKPITKSVPATSRPGSAYIVPEPYGTVLVISPWNYPISLLLKPLIGAVSAGNTVLLKPSEVSTATSLLLHTLIPQYLDKECIQIVLGGPQETERILTYQFDYIFYTGSTVIGKKIMKAASEFLTPVTLELGGKSPVIIDDSANLSVAAKRIVWGKFTCNAGQTCVAPDYILCIGHELKEKFIREVIEKIHTNFTAKLQKR